MTVSIIYRVRGRDVIPQRLVAIGMVLLLTLLLPLSLLAARLVAVGSSDLGKLLPPVLAHLSTIVGLLASLGTLWLLFVVVYMVVPNTPVPFRYAWRGALVAAVLFGAFIRPLLPPNLSCAWSWGTLCCHGYVAISPLVSEAKAPILPANFAQEPTHRSLIRKHLPVRPTRRCR